MVKGAYPSVMADRRLPGIMYWLVLELNPSHLRRLANTVRRLDL